MGKKTASKYELLEKTKPKGPKKTASKSSSAKKKMKEFFSKDGKFLIVKLLMVALLLVLPLTLLLCITTDPVQIDNTWLGFVVHLYISATSLLITLAACMFNGLLLLPLYLAFFTINFLLWLFNCNSETVVEQIVTTTAAAGPELQDRLLEALLMLIPSGLLTPLIYLYLNAGKPVKQGGETILLLNSKGDWEFAPSAKRNAKVKFSNQCQFLAKVKF